MINVMNEALRRIVLTGSIKEDTSAQFLEQITALECVDMVKPISIYIDTYGGNLDAAILMYDAIKACCCPIVTIGMGKVMSAGVLLLAAGEQGSRFITQNTRVMIHEISSVSMGPISEMERAMIENKNMQDVYINLLSTDTGVSKAKLLKDMQKETFMSSSQAIKYGIADKIVPIRKSIKEINKKIKA